MVEFTPYSSIVPFFADAAEPGIPEFDANRIMAYAQYEQFYWNHPESFKLMARGEDEQPIYLPSARRIIEATNRFLAVGFDYAIDPTVGTPDARTQLDLAFKGLFKRELFNVKFNAQRRWGLVRGDAIWHITADGTKPEGTRISLHDVHPKRYFPIVDADDPTRVVGCHLVETIADPRDKTKQLIRRQTYRKELDKLNQPTGLITSELSLWEVGKWDDRFLEPKDLKLVQVITPATPLPTAITTLPVYHIRNTWDEYAFGSSTLRGIETILAGANQGVSDQALAMAMNGLGSYWTDAAPPLDAGGAPTDWEFGPLRMTEVPPGSTVGRLEGVGSVAPSIEHLNFILESAQTGVGVPDIAAGKVDVTVAESGISLRLQLAPIIAANGEREQTMIGTYDQMFFDLRTMWFPAYESLTLEAEIAAIVDDPLPKNHDAEVQEVIDLYTAKLLTAEEARTRLIDLGWEIEANSASLLKEATASALAADPFAARSNAELANNQGGPNALPVAGGPAAGGPGGRNGTVVPA
jgi:hypothetical protein